MGKDYKRGQTLSEEGPDIFSKPVTRPEMKAVDEATAGAGLSQ